MNENHSISKKKKREREKKKSFKSVGTLRFLILVHHLKSTVLTVNTFESSPLAFHQIQKSTAMSIISVLYTPYHILRDKDSYFNWNINVNTLFV